ncbi:hypothetical protein N480_19420 [Pseudoalteromonas luteoviolacea S2607]|nr:hypothetical protein N480_19420 [Pseudoalteromonas luteoviolacea S2607]
MFFVRLSEASLCIVLLYGVDIFKTSVLFKAVYG